MTGGPFTIADRYQIAGEPVGEGGMGVVYKAWDLVTRRNVAIKTMRGSIDAVALELFAKEWTVLSRINHPNIVDIFDTGEFEEGGQKKPFFVMPFLGGRTFDSLIRNASPRLTVERVVEIILQTCRGLQAAHENGLVHRDVKPSNIFVMEDDTVKVIDFGVAHLAGAETVTGIKGTLQYMSPEQLDMKGVSPASDVFSLAVVGYEALTGRKPFARRTDFETVEAIRRHVPPPVCDLNPLVSDLVSRVIHKALAKAPWHRFSTARDFSDTLQKAFNNQPIERFEKSKLQPRIERVKRAHAEGDLQFASEVLGELEAEGNFDPEMTVLRLQIDQAMRQKSIWQLLESARARREEDELPLALQKIEEVLQIDPGNADALSLRTDIERERSEGQIENWFRLAEQHLHQNSFAQARQALQEVLKIDPGNKRAREALAGVDRREQEISRIRNEKERLYQGALSSYQSGEISSALSKLEKILEFSRTSPESGIPDRDAQYQGLYNEIRTERDAAKTAWAEGRRCLADRNFDRALEICADFLNRYPGEPLFQALKLEAEENRRQEHSSFIAEVARRADAEPDLDRRFNILKDACERFPDDSHLQKSLRLIRDRRDLVNSIVAKAGQYEERRQFGEALGQWDILRSIYPQYPGIEFEVERLTRRRDEQFREEAKGRWVDQIDRTLATGDYARARELVRTALNEFPDDSELAGLDEICRQALERATEAQTWLERGQKLCADHEHGEGLEALRKAAALDSTNPGIRAALLNALIEQAHLVVARDWRGAEPLVREALGMEAGHPLAKSLQGLVLDYKRQEIVSESMAQARRLQAAADLTGAIATIEAALREYPNEARLLQLRSTLKSAHSAARQLKEQTEAIAAEPAAAAPNVVRDGLEEAAPQPMASAAAAAAGEAKVPEAGAGPAPLIEPWETAVQMPPRPAAKNGNADAPSSTAIPAGEAPEQGIAKRRVPLPGFSTPHSWPMHWGAFALFPIIVIVVLIVSKPPHRKTVNAVAPRNYPVRIQADVNGAELVFGGKPLASPSLLLTPGRHTVEARALGYRTASRTFTVSARDAGIRTIALHLEPEPIRLRVSSDLKSGQISIDGRPASPLQDGGFVDEAVALSAEHTLTLNQDGREYLSVSFRADPGKPVIFSAPLKASDRNAVAVSSLGDQAWIYSSSTLLQAGLAGQTPQPIPAAGLAFNGLWSDSELMAVDGDNTKSLPVDVGNAPSLSIVLSSDPNTATLRIESKVPDADVSVQGRKPRRMHGGSATLLLAPGTYTIRVSKEGFSQETRTVELKKGASLTLPAFDLKPVVKSASLVITDGTPGAEVWIDDHDAGTLDENGGFSKEGISPESHVVTLRKEAFEEREITKSFSAGQSIRLAASEARLTPFGAIVFQVVPESAAVSYRRESEEQAHPATNGGTARLQAGRYVVSASAADRKPRTERITVGAGATFKVDWFLDMLPKAVTPAVEAHACESDGWTGVEDGGWRYHKGKAAVWCRSSEGIFKFVVRRPEDTTVFHRLGRIEWIIDSKDAGNRIEYVLDQKSLERRVISNGKKVTTKRSVTMPLGDTWNLEINIGRGRIEIRSAGKLLDEFARPDPAQPLGQFGFQGDITLKPQ